MVDHEVISLKNSAPTTTVGLEVDHLLQSVSSRNSGSVGKKLLDLGVEFLLFVRVAGNVV